MFMYNIYNNLRKIIEKLTGYPYDPELAKEYIWAWKYTGIRPYRMELTEIGKLPSFRFKKGEVTYFCSPNPKGEYIIGNIDTAGFTDHKRYKRRAFLIAKYLQKRPYNCSKEEAVSFCAKAINIEKEHKGEIIDTSEFSLRTSEHAIISFS